MGVHELNYPAKVQINDITVRDGSARRNLDSYGSQAFLP